MSLLQQQVLDLMEKGEIHQYTKKQVEKLSEERLQAILEEYERKQLDELNEAVTDTVICKFEEGLKYCKWIKQDSRLAINLQKKKLFRKDLKSVISYLTPFLPFVGLLEGGAVVVSEMVDCAADNMNADKTKAQEEPKPKKKKESKKKEQSSEESKTSEEAAEEPE